MGFSGKSPSFLLQMLNHNSCFSPNSSVSFWIFFPVILQDDFESLFVLNFLLIYWQVLLFFEKSFYLLFLQAPFLQDKSSVHSLGSFTFFPMTHLSRAEERRTQPMTRADSACLQQGLQASKGDIVPSASPKTAICLPQKVSCLPYKRQINTNNSTSILSKTSFALIHISVFHLTTCTTNFF